MDVCRGIDRYVGVPYSEGPVLVSLYIPLSCSLSRAPVVFFHSSTLTCSGPSSFVIRALLGWTEREGEGREGGREKRRRKGEKNRGRESRKGEREE